MEVDSSVQVPLPTEPEIEMATSPAPIPIPLDHLGDEQMIDHDPQPDSAEVIDDDNYAVEDELDLDETEVAIADQQAEQDQDLMIDDELGYELQFEAPPAGLVNPDGTQTSALGNSVDHNPAQLDPVGQAFELDQSKIEADLPESAITAQTQQTHSATPYIPEPSVDSPAPADHTASQTGALSPHHALAAQHQHSSDETKHQDQSISHTDSRHTRLNQSQDMTQGQDGDPSKQRNQVDIEQRKGQPGEKDEVEVTTTQSNEGGQGGRGGAPVQNNEVNVYPDGDKGKAKAIEGCTCGAGGREDRPVLRKDLLEGVEFDEEGEVEAAGAEAGPVVLLTHQNTTYSLFRPTTDSATRQPLETLFPAAPVPEESTTKTASPELYYAPIASLFAALRTFFPAIPTSEELLIAFEAIGISLAEDNVHAGQVSLFDFDRIQVGCGLPGKLQVTLESQPRFSTGFNALVEHIARSRDGGDAALGEVQGGEGEEGYVAEGDGSFVDGEYAAGDGAPATDDETAVGERDESEYYDPEGGEGEAYNLEEALAEMDSDDLEAVIEGVEDDYIESEEAIYEAHDGDSHDELAEGDDGEPDVLLPEDGQEVGVDGALTAGEVADATIEAGTEPVGAMDEPVEVGVEGIPLTAHVSVDAGEGEDELIVAIPPDELEALDEAAELYEAEAQGVEGVVGQLDEVGELEDQVEEPLEAEGEGEVEAARSLTGKLRARRSGPRRQLLTRIRHLCRHARRRSRRAC